MSCRQRPDAVTHHPVPGTLRPKSNPVFAGHLSLSPDLILAKEGQNYIIATESINKAPYENMHFFQLKLNHSQIVKE